MKSIDKSALCEGIGIDVAKAHLDIFVPGTKKVVRIKNTPEALVAWSKNVSPTRIAIEASGGYERAVVLTLPSLGFQVEMYNPRKVRRSADVLGFTAKTDELDARLLSRISGILPAPEAPDADKYASRDRSRRIHKMTERIANLKKQKQTARLDPLVLESINEEIEMLEAMLKRFKKSVAKQMTPAEKERVKLLKTVPGLGPETARTLSAELPDDLSDYTGPQLCSYVGLAPIDSSSGTKVGKKHIRKGKPWVKRNLYLCALSILRVDPVMQRRYASILAKGKGHILAAVAIMRHLVLRAVVVLKRGTPWEIRPKP